MEQLLSERSFPLLKAAATAREALIPEGFRKPKEIEHRDVPTWGALCAPLYELLPYISPLESKSNRPLEFTFSDQIHTLVYLHAEEYSSGRALLEDINDPKQFPPEHLPQDGLPRSTFFEAIHSRGLPQMMETFERLSCKAAKALGTKYNKLGDLRALDGSLVEATLSMEWADYTAKTNKAKVHLVFDLNCSIPRKIQLTEGKAPERPVASQQLQINQTGVMDRGYQDHSRFDTWQEEGKFFVCRIKQNTQKTIVKELPIPPKSNIIFHAEVYLGDNQHRTQHTVVLVGIRVGRKIYWIATNRTDLTAQEITFIYRLRWEIEKFFAKKHLNVYHLIARSFHGLMMQLLAGLITYLLLVIYFYWRLDEHPSLSRFRQLRRDIRRERAPRSVNTKRMDDHRIIILLFMTDQQRNGRTQSVIIAIF